MTGNADVVAMVRDTGKVRWVTPLTRYEDEKKRVPVLWGGPVLAGDRLLLTSSLGDLVAVSPYTGEVMGKVDLRDRVRLGPRHCQPDHLYPHQIPGDFIALR